MKFTTQYNKVKNEYYTVSKKILNYEKERTLEDVDRIKQYVTEILTVYNNFVRFIRENLPSQSEIIRNKVNLKFETFYERNFLRCLHTLKYDTVLPERYSEINLDALVAYDEQAFGGSFDDQDIHEDDLNSDDEKTDPSDDSKLKLESNAARESQLETVNDSFTIGNRTERIMVLTRNEYHNMCTRTINAVFSGDPLGLQPFIDSIEALEELDETNTLGTTLKRCILMKLSGIARDCIPDDTNGQLTVAQIKQKLKDTIKPEPSIVVEGRLLALKADRTNFSDFTKRVETLAEQLQRSLILEGMPFELANKYTIRNTVELCRSNTTMSGVKSVLSAKDFKDAKDVVAKFVTQSRTEAGEQQVLHYRANRMNYQNNRAYHHNQRGRGNNFQQRNFNGQNRGGNNYGRNGYHNNQQNRGNFRGRGNYRGNGQNNYRGNGYNNYRGNNRNIMYAENGMAPPPGAAQAQNVQVNQAGNQNA